MEKLSTKIKKEVAPPAEISGNLSDMYEKDGSDNAELNFYERSVHEFSSDDIELQESSETAIRRIEDDFLESDPDAVISRSFHLLSGGRLEVSVYSKVEGGVPEKRTGILDPKGWKGTIDRKKIVLMESCTQGVVDTKMSVLNQYFGVGNYDEEKLLEIKESVTIDGENIVIKYSYSENPMQIPLSKTINFPRSYYSVIEKNH